MITNCNCTVIRTDDSDNYVIVGRYPCMWQSHEGYRAAEYGEELTSETRIYIPDLTADVQKGDCVTQEEISESDSNEIDVSDMLSVVTISRNNYGSKSMRHIKVVAK